MDRPKSQKPQKPKATEATKATKAKSHKSQKPQKPKATKARSHRSQKPEATKNKKPKKKQKKTKNKYPSLFAIAGLNRRRACQHGVGGAKMDILTNTARAASSMYNFTWLASISAPISASTQLASLWSFLFPLFAIEYLMGIPDCCDCCDCDCASFAGLKPSKPLLPVFLTCLLVHPCRDKDCVLFERLVREILDSARFSRRRATTLLEKSSHSKECGPMMTTSGCHAMTPISIHSLPRAALFRPMIESSVDD